MTEPVAPSTPLRVLVVDDERLARARLRALLGDCLPPVLVVGEAASAVQAMGVLQHHPVDVALVDIQMPGADGLAMAQAVRAMTRPPALIFVTAHAEHALQAFDLEALDYLTKPVRLQRLQQALQKVQRLHQPARAAEPDALQEVLLIQERGRTERVPLLEVLYFKAELKYITVRTFMRSFVLDGSLNEIEAKYPTQFVRVHRNALVARTAMRALEKHFDPEEGEGWALRLVGVEELVAVSRRQLTTVRDLLSQ
ncbi:MAG: LytR/AlgR family response regulator transcription factor [Rhodoferax sp.]